MGGIAVSFPALRHRDFTLLWIVDGTGRLYVAKNGTSTIAIYAPGASGSDAPVDSIAGPGTGLSSPAYITF